MSHSLKNTLFGKTTQWETASVVLIPVPWSVTASYEEGSEKAPECILKASHQLDLFDVEHKDAFLKKEVFMLPLPTALEKKNKKERKKALHLIEKQAQGKPLNEKDKKLLKEVNTACEQMNAWVYEMSLQQLEQNKVVGVVGGDHSSPLGALQAIKETKKDFGILHIDAHCDLRVAYEGFTYSHASIMDNVLKTAEPKKLVQVGIRDFCKEEFERTQTDSRISCFFDRTLKKQSFQGQNWHEAVQNIIKELPENVYVSLDVDGLEYQYAPRTGTPVPGGLSFSECVYLMESVVNSKRKIIGFDVCEAAPSSSFGEWNENVAARLIFYLSLLSEA